MVQGGTSRDLTLDGVHLVIQLDTMHLKQPCDDVLKERKHEHSPRRVRVSKVREVFLADVRGKKAPRNGVYVRFKVDRTTSKRIRYGFITVKSTTLIGLNSPRKNKTLPAIRSVEPRRTHIPV
ncbi:hypothetical protein TNCV_3291331 [Trichonephila clavipes]|nr:hypothetical protein TNCV_3291331 [Trichonephila clavipes]